MSLPGIKGYPYTEWSYNENLDEGTFTLGLNGSKLVGELSGDRMADCMRMCLIGFELCIEQDPDTYGSMSFEEFFDSYLLP